MTDTADDIFGWGVVAIYTALLTYFLVWGFRLPKKGSGWGRLI